MQGVYLELYYNGVLLVIKDIDSDKDITGLIQIEKSIIRAPKKTIDTPSNTLKRYTLKNEENNLEFSFFIAQSVHMPLDFSIGLMYNGYLLYRCNGFHGTTRAGFYSAEHHAYPHAHILSFDDIQRGKGKKPSTIVNLKDKYIDIQSAVVYFCKTCGIINYSKYF